MYNPRPQTGALETTIDEDGFSFYFAIKQYYADQKLIFPKEIIDLNVLDRLAFLKDNVEIKDYPQHLSRNDENDLLQMNPEKRLYFPKIRHPASRKSVGKKRFFYFIPTTGSKDNDIYCYLGEKQAFFVPEVVVKKREAGN